MRSIISLCGLFNQFREKVIPKADSAPLILIFGFISNHVIQELKQLAKVARRLFIRRG